MSENRAITPSVQSGANLSAPESKHECIETWLATASRDELASRLRDIYAGKIKLIEANNDFEALSAWLSGYENNSIETFRAFKLEAEKLLIWLAREKGFGYNNLPMLTRKEAGNYIKFLQSQKLSIEFSKDLLKFFDRKDQPFTTSPLSLSTVQRARNVLSRMFQGLREIRGPHGPYVEFNPWFNIKVKSYAMTANKACQRKRETDIEGDVPAAISDHPFDFPDGVDVSERIIDSEEWEILNQAVEQLPKEGRREQANYQRSKWVLALLYYAFLRRKEATLLRMGDIHKAQGSWWITVRQGKGGKARKVSAPAKLIDALQVYRLSYDLPALPRKSETMPAILPIYWHGQENTEPLTSQVVYTIIKDLCQHALLSPNVDPESDLAKKLQLISPHWTRHTGISHALENGAEARMVQKQAGHASLNTTAIYDHKEKHRWAKEMEKL